MAPPIPPIDEAAAEDARARQASLTKPPGSLGRLEELAIRLAGVQGAAIPVVHRKTVVVAAADHGVAAQGVSAYPSEVTAQMVRNFLSGGAAVNQLAGVACADVVVVDAGVATPITDARLTNRRRGAGTADFTRGPAMQNADAERLLQDGVEMGAGIDSEIVILGDMGIGNTTAAAALTAALLGLSADAVTGRGTGVDDDGYARKVEAVTRALGVNRPDPAGGAAALAAVGGFELAFLAGVALGAASRRRCVVLDGFPTSTAALSASRIEPGVTPYLVASHLSVERGHRAILDELGLEPLLDLRLRLGEGTGGLLAAMLIEAAVRAHAGMATFEEAAVSRSPQATRLGEGVSVGEGGG